MTALDVLADHVREHVPITSVIGETTSLIADPRTDGVYLGSCPVCQGEIIVSERAGGCWHCTCGEGDVLAFVERHRGLTHRAAIIELCGRIFAPDDPGQRPAGCDNV